MNKKKENPKGFTLIELLIVIAIIGILASAVLVSLSSSKDKARGVKFKAYVSQVSSLTEKAIVSGSFDNVPVNAGGCLGIYSGTCWSSNANLNTPDTDINNALQTIGTIPTGEYSPYTTSTNHAVAIIKLSSNTCSRTCIYRKFGLYEFV